VPPTTDAALSIPPPHNSPAPSPAARPWPRPRGDKRDDLLTGSALVGSDAARIIVAATPAAAA
jgi:hypothetical protein